MEWSGGADTMEEILSRIHEREEAAVKRERAMAYAFSHQVRLSLKTLFIFYIMMPLISNSPFIKFN